ncbi:hypothetical protein GPECTOR_59g692 [Gonium pectorale]|uniref:Uncharacterized protein n=1 Tax=Gonium pectorale TaxID=33097 RepID=A0A150G5N9_GONPE|nr:hypothetical protein GPECTOR_59g692 [Gonium pectorale]|eukprot:KXZ45083.1 hypothetical protein GPECTOR_59g692 [Gonium pectorale]
MEALLDGGHGWPECGDPRDTQANNFVKVVPLVARFAGLPELEAAVDAAVRAQQNNDEAVAYAMAAALVLERVVQSGPTAIPDAWRSQTRLYGTVEVLAEQLVEHRPPPQPQQQQASGMVPVV